jgi:hypothetical protein
MPVSSVRESTIPQLIAEGLNHPAALAEPNTVRKKSSSNLNLRFLGACAMIGGDETSPSIFSGG